MQIFKDEKLTEEISLLDLGTAIAGQTKSYTFFIKNDLKVKVEDLEFFIENKEVVINNYPKFLNPSESGSLVVTWTPSLKVKKGLKTELRVKGYELYLP